MVTSADVGIEGRRHHLGGNAAGGAGAVYPAEEPGMDIAGAIRQHQPADVVGHPVEPLRPEGRRFADRHFDVVRNRLPDRSLADALDEVERVVEQPVNGASERWPVGGIERIRGNWLLGGR